MKKHKLLIVLGILITITITVNACISYSCPTYSKSTKEPEKKFI